MLKFDEKQPVYVVVADIEEKKPLEDKQVISVNLPQPWVSMPYTKVLLVTNEDYLKRWNIQLWRVERKKGVVVSTVGETEYAKPVELANSNPILAGLELAESMGGKEICLMGLEIPNGKTPQILEDYIKGSKAKIHFGHLPEKKAEPKKKTKKETK